MAKGKGYPRHGRTSADTRKEAKAEVRTTKEQQERIASLKASVNRTK